MSSDPSPVQKLVALQPPITKILASTTPGPTIAIIVGVHGNEKGPQLEWEWLKSIKIQKGTLHLIFANPTAAELNTRFVNINLNRRFGKNLNEFPEDTNARIIESVLDKCEASLDLHMYNESMDRPFAICNRRSNSHAKLLPIKFIINLPDNADGGGTDDYMSSKGKIGICFESGSVERPQDYSTEIQEGVKAFLGAYGLIGHNATPNNDVKILVKASTKRVEHSDLKFSREYSSFEEIKQGEVICTENNQEVLAPSDGYILFPRQNNPVGTEAFYTLIDA